MPAKGRTPMPDHPILFGPEMVRAILAGRKTMTRRVIKPQPHPDFLARGIAGMAAQWPKQNGIRIFMKDGCSELVKCPSGQPGEKLWVRERFALSGDDAFWFAADCDDGPANEVCQYPDGRYFEGHWRPSIFMPRKFSRITLEITSIWIEQVQDITDGEAIQEGIDRTNTSITGYAIQRFKTLWDSINKKRGFGWDSNPWVWVIKFKKI